ncbi:MAG: serine--tRNA ligase [Bauldia sp.]
MLDIRWIRDNQETLDRALRNRGAEPAAARLAALDEERRTLIVRLEQAQARRNAASKEINFAMVEQDQAKTAELKAEVSALKVFLQQAEDDRRRIEKELNDALAVIPNVPADDVPVGDANANAEYRRWGEKPGLNDAKEHFDIGAPLGMDFETAAKLSGARFVVLKGPLARMERALGQFMLDLHTTEHGYTEVAPPLLVADKVAFGTGQLPKAAEDMFQTSQTIFETVEFDIGGNIWEPAIVREPETRQKYQEALTRGRPRISRLDEFPNKLLSVVQRLWLIPTAEVPLTNLVRESIRDEAELPLRFAALTPCFRSEAGAAGKDTRGMLRQHQFDKVELVSITAPETSRDEHERMLVCAEEVMKRLDLHYRVVTLSTGDMGFAAEKTYDIEVWLPGQGTYREISSCSRCGDFQARRMQARYRPKEGKGTRLVHTLNGSGVAVGRALIAVVENYQNPDGSVTVPDALRSYMGGLERIGG